SVPLSSTTVVSSNEVLRRFFPLAPASILHPRLGGRSIFYPTLWLSRIAC
ncbi:unnamed protein product, partial [Ectocarpus sp. 12 AP-2014]